MGNYRIAENFRGINFPATYLLRDKIFTNAVKVTITIMQIFKIGEKNSWIKFSPMRAGGKIGKNFLLVKIFSRTVTGFHEF